MLLTHGGKVSSISKQKSVTLRTSFCEDDIEETDYEANALHGQPPKHKNYYLHKHMAILTSLSSTTNIYPILNCSSPISH
jgi:hypothetical protein